LISYYRAAEKQITSLARIQLSKGRRRKETVQIKFPFAKKKGENNRRVLKYATKRKCIIGQIFQARYSPRGM
jgi:hypothetical protein